MQETKHCPYCGEEIQSVAIKCKFCGEALDKQAVNQFNQNGQIPLGFIKDTNGNVIPKPNGFNFLAFLFGPVYFAGYKNITNGILIYASLYVFFMRGIRNTILFGYEEYFQLFSALLSIFIIIYHLVCGFVANSTLAIKQEKFSWVYSIGYILLIFVINVGIFITNI